MSQPATEHGLVRCRVCGEALDRRSAVESDVQDVPGGMTWAWAHPDCENVAAIPAFRGLRLAASTDAGRS